jgi:hypothetical protein
MCCELTFKFHRRNFTPFIKKYYEFYFEDKADDKDKNSAPHFRYGLCVGFVPGWVNISHQMPFAVRVDWKELRDFSSFVICVLQT